MVPGHGAWGSGFEFLIRTHKVKLRRALQSSTPHPPPFVGPPLPWGEGGERSEPREGSLSAKTDAGANMEHYFMCSY